MNEHLCVSLNPLVKLVISHFRIIDPDLVADHKARLRLARNDQISQVAIIRLDIALSRCKAKALFPHSQHTNTHLSGFTELTKGVTLPSQTTCQTTPKSVPRRTTYPAPPDPSGYRVPECLTHHTAV